MNKTIAAISTPIGNGGIAVIRISGDSAVEIADKVYRGSKPLSQAKSHTIHYGHIIDKNGNTIDEVLVSVMLAPKTFTCENIVEINTHGGILACRSVLDAVIQAGAYPAEAGEFTKRAFLNGRIDLSQAEAVIDIINAKTELAGRNAVSQLEGNLSKKINSIRDTLVSTAAHMQVSIDYPDEDLEDITIDEIINLCKDCSIDIDTLLKTGDSGKIIRDGISTAIVGKPNVGKSSLLNMLAMEERSIVTEIEGTTRDVIEEYVNLGGIPLKLLDTAGIRQTEDIVEKIGVERSRRSIEEADFIIVVIDGSRQLDENDIDILKSTSNRKRVILINKSDLTSCTEKTDLEKFAKDCAIIDISAKQGNGMTELENEIKRIYHLGDISQNDSRIITNMRHKSALAKAYESIMNAINALDAGMPQDIASIDINMTIDFLGEITGATVTEDVVDNIFHNFCVGK